MKLRTRLDLFSAALLSALGASQVVACGGSSLMTPGSDGGTGSGGSSGAGTAGAATAGAATAGAASGGSSGAGTAGAGSAGAPHAGSGSGGGAGDSNHFPCKNPIDLGGGLIQCDGFTHRETSGMCSSKVPRPDPYPTTSPSAQCKMDSDCSAKPHGWCGGGGQVPGPYCNYGCVNDSECGMNQLCECGDPVGRCVQADCATDADCSSGFLCKSYDQSGGCGITNFTCQSPADGCGSDADCVGSAAGNLCRFDVTVKHFACSFGGCAIGRPFLVAGEPRLALAAARTDWRELALLPRLEQLDAALCAQLAEEWTRVALMEHASIAAFARFTLQLMSLGAPPELIERATAAMADETKHAKACFAVASAYTPVPVGPGPLAIDRSLEGTSLEQIVLNTLREGCVGETVAAIEAREAAEHAQDPALKQLLLVISQDETQHAELAFRFVQWALSVGDASLATAVREELAQLAAAAARDAASAETHDNELLSHGIVSQSLRRTIRAQAFASVILPCAAALGASQRGALDPAPRSAGGPAAHNEASTWSSAS